MIPFKQVYRKQYKGGDGWAICMALTPMPDMSGLWMLQASTGTPEYRARGRVFEGKEGNVIVIADKYQVLFEPLTLERWREMRDSVSGFEHLEPLLTSDEAVQDWYWKEFAINAMNVELSPAKVIKRLQTGG